MDRMGNVLERSIGPPSIGNRDEQPLASVNDLESSNDEGVIQCDADECAELFIVM